MFEEQMVTEPVKKQPSVEPIAEEDNEESTILDQGEDEAGDAIIEQMTEDVSQGIKDQIIDLEAEQ